MVTQHMGRTAGRRKDPLRAGLSGFTQHMGRAANRRKNRLLLDYAERKNVYGGYRMKQHRFWAGAMLVCMLMLIYTGHKHR